MGGGQQPTAEGQQKFMQLQQLALELAIGKKEADARQSAHDTSTGAGVTAPKEPEPPAPPTETTKPDEEMPELTAEEQKALEEAQAAAEAAFEQAYPAKLDEEEKEVYEKRKAAARHRAARGPYSPKQT